MSLLTGMHRYYEEILTSSHLLNYRKLCSQKAMFSHSSESFIKFDSTFKTWKESLQLKYHYFLNLYKLGQYEELLPIRHTLCFFTWQWKLIPQIKTVLDGYHIYDRFSSLILICTFNVKGLISKLLHNLLLMVDSSPLPQNKDCANGVFFHYMCKDDLCYQTNATTQVFTLDLLIIKLL
jgi:hypothetical protein